MDLLEYQAKELFEQVGIPVLPSQQIYDPRDLKQLKISYPIVLKSQVRVGGRGKAGGIKFVNNTIDAIAAARNIFNLSIFGEYPQVLLAEARYNAERELFLAIVLDYELKRPVLLGSAHGGIDVKALLDNLQKVVVEEDFYPFYARRLAIKMGLSGKPIQSISSIIEKMYYLFLRKDLNLIEINPLGIDREGKVMALDGKINVNDSGLMRHPSLLELIKEDSKRINPKGEFQVRGISLLDGIDEKGNIAIICNGLDLALATWDTIIINKGKLCCCYVFDEDKTKDNDNIEGNCWYEKPLMATLDKIVETRSIRTVLINFLDDRKNSEKLVKVLIDYLQPSADLAGGTICVAASALPTPESISSKTKKTDRFHFVLHLSAAAIEGVNDLITDLPISLYDNLEIAVDRTISLTKAR